MRWFPFLGYVTNEEDPSLAEYLDLAPDREWKIFIFEWFSFTYAFYAYTKPVP